MQKLAPLPTPEAIQWVRKNILTQEEQENTITHQNPSSVSNNPTATIQTPTRTLFLKQLSPYWNHEIETLITKQLSPHPNTLTHIADNPQHKLIITEHIITSTKKTWTPQTYLQALDTFTEIQPLLTPQTFPQQKDLPIPRMTHIPSNKHHMLHGLRLIENQQQSPTFLRNKTNLQTLLHLTHNALTSTYTAPITLQHTDATPENWILTENKPILIDYGTYAYAPHYWDMAICSITNPLPPKIKLKHIHPNSAPHITNTALYFLTILLSHKTNPEHDKHKEWIQKYIQRTLDVLHELHPTLFLPPQKNVYKIQ